MKSKKITKLLTVLMVSTMVMSGVQGVTSLGMINTPSIAYAETTGTGLQTSTGVISGTVKYADKIPSSATLEEMTAISTLINPTDKSDYFETNATTGDIIFSPQKIYVSNNVYHCTKGSDATKSDTFIHVFSMELGSSVGKVIKNYTISTYIGGNFTEKHTYSKEMTDTKAYDYIKTETPAPKTYTSVRLGGNDRYGTSLEIAKEYSSTKVDSVVLASATDFPDALSGSVLAKKYNAPILIVGANSSNNTETLKYIKNNLKENGKVYVLGGTGAVSDSILDSVKTLGFTDIERLGGLDRYETNLKIVNELEVAKGSPIVVANSLVFADSLSVSSVASIKGMPIFLTGDSMKSATLDSIKGIAPTDIYIVGGTGAVSQAVENQLKDLGKVTRIGGLNRYETSLSIAKHFNLDTTNVALANGMDFPDALTGSSLASKNNAPILLVEENVTNQKTYLDSTKINKIYILGGTGAVSDSIVSNLKK